MTKIFAFAGVLLAATGGLATSVDAQAPHYAYGYADGHDNRINYRQHIGAPRYWRSARGEICYRRSDGVRRCEAPNARQDGRRSHHNERGHGWR
ncbi:hypothetical protein SAMN05192583_3139 [Sphingomonas gellani]|uniref:Uncharacterized protein n=1 Tax=Sphingomonas gellani TaxID=1166340 RepID=A0A1H8HY70_9SPHN|nr:hypothetical protein [Sphingomonas gellani]SEN60895.1 hypothetical protein SAMN05192583_3139 [Sphingomonas gellani]